jgi:hypothetical protein
MVDARISGEVRRVIHRRYHIHVYRFESCPDYKKNNMKRLFLFLLRKYSKTESQRIEIYQELWYQTKSEYDEATAFENMRNMNIEVLMSTPFFVSRVALGQYEDLKNLKEELGKSFDESTELTFLRFHKSVKK